MDLFIEILAVALNLMYLGLLIKERIECWFFGIAGSLVSIYLFYSLGLYSESILYVYYVVIGVYGYFLWKKKEAQKDVLQVQKIGLKKQMLLIAGGVIVAYSVGFGFENYSDATNPYLDAFTTVFSFIASFLEAKKILSSWVFWIVINTATIVLYLQQNLYVYLLLTIVYVVFSVIGLIEWNKKYETSKVETYNI